MIQTRKTKKINILYIKTVIYSILLLEYLAKSFNKNLKLKLKRPLMLNINKKETILYSTNRHKIAQKHFKSNYKIFKLSFELNGSSQKILKKNYIYIMKYIQLLKTIEITNINLFNIKSFSELKLLIR